MTEWRGLLDADPAEPEVQTFLERHPSLIPGATDNIGPHGHHGVCWGAVIKQPELPGLDRRVPDFMWVRRDTAAVRPILVEIEAPSKRWVHREPLTQRRVDAGARPTHRVEGVVRRSLEPADLPTSVRARRLLAPSA